MGGEGRGMIISLLVVWFNFWSGTIFVIDLTIFYRKKILTKSAFVILGFRICCPS